MGDAIWLIKTGGKVRGPMDAEEIERAILEREFFALDEVACPQDRWKYLRDVDPFSRIFTMMKNREDYLNDHSTISDTLGNSTQTESHSGSQGSFNKKTPTPDTPKLREQSSVRTYGFDHDPAVQRRVRYLGGRRLLWVLAFLTVGIFLGIQLQSRRASKATAVSFEQAFAEAQRARLRGDHDAAIDWFEKALALRPEDRSVRLERIPLFIDREDYVTARRDLEWLDLNTTGTALAEVQNLKGIIFLRSGEEAMARDTFQTALQSDAQFRPAQFNLAMSLYLLKTPGDIPNLIIPLLRSEGVDPVVEIFAAESLCHVLDLCKTDETVRELVLDRLSRRAQAGLMYSGQSIVLKLLLEKKLDLAHPKPPLETLESILDRDPRIEGDMLLDPRFYRDAMGDKFLLQQINDIAQTWSLKSPRILAVVGILQFLAGDRLEGKKMILDASAQNPNDPLLLALKSYVLESVSGDAITSLELSVQYSHFENLPRMLKARACLEKQDLVCAEQNWKMLLEINPNSIQAMAGLAEVNVIQRRMDQAQVFLRQGLGIEANYRPLLKVQDRVLGGGR